MQQRRDVVVRELVDFGFHLVELLTLTRGQWATSGPQPAVTLPAAVAGVTITATDLVFTGQVA